MCLQKDGGSVELDSGSVRSDGDSPSPSPSRITQDEYNMSMNEETIQQMQQMHCFGEMMAADADVMFFMSTTPGNS